MIKIKNLSFAYTKNNNVINDVNLNIPSSIYLSILGENGSSKSTLIKLILGLLKPTSGEISISSKKISYVPQKIDNFNSDFPITVYELLKSHAKAIKIKDSNIINDVLTQVNMLDFKNKLIGNLSGGQQQRIFIARSLLGDPDLIILDEPSTGVDEKSQNEIYPILETLNSKYKKTIISVEHNTKTALKYSTHILKIENGNFNLYTKDEFKKSLSNDNSVFKII